METLNEVEIDQINGGAELGNCLDPNPPAPQKTYLQRVIDWLMS